MPIRKDIKTVRNAILTIGETIIASGAGADKTSAYAALINSYCRLLLTRNRRSKPKHDPYRDGDPEYYNTLIGDQDTTE
jgi:hypothetical protein